MLKIFGSLLMSLLIFQFTPSWATAEDINTFTEEFYMGLSDIIENNINNPDVCVARVNDYYSARKELIEKIQDLSKEPMAEAMSMGIKMIKNYESMSEEELKAHKQQALAKQSEFEGMNSMALPQATRYGRILEEFTRMYPQQGMQVGLKTMELLPEMDGFKDN